MIQREQAVRIKWRGYCVRALYRDDGEAQERMRGMETKVEKIMVVCNAVVGRFTMSRTAIFLVVWWWASDVSRCLASFRDGGDVTSRLPRLSWHPRCIPSGDDEVGNCLERRAEMGQIPSSSACLPPPLGPWRAPCDATWSICWTVGGRAARQ